MAELKKTQKKDPEEDIAFREQIVKYAGFGAFVFVLAFMVDLL